MITVRLKFQCFDGQLGKSLGQKAFLFVLTIFMFDQMSNKFCFRQVNFKLMGHCIVCFFLKMPQSPMTFKTAAKFLFSSSSLWATWWCINLKQGIRKTLNLSHLDNAIHNRFWKHSPRGRPCISPCTRHNLSINLALSSTD